MPRPRTGRDEVVGHAAAGQVDDGVELEHLLHHDARLAPVAVEQHVDQVEGVAGAGVPAEDQQGLVVGGRTRSARPSSSMLTVTSSNRSPQRRALRRNQRISR